MLPTVTEPAMFLRLNSKIYQQSKTKSYRGIFFNSLIIGKKQQLCITINN